MSNHRTGVRVVIPILGTVLITGCATLVRGLGGEMADDYSSWPPKQRLVENSVGFHLNPELRNHVSTCKIIDSDEILNRADRSYVPREVRNEMNMDGPGESVDLAGGSLLHYIYLGDEILRPINTPSGVRFLNPEYTGAPEDLLLPPDTRFDGFRLMRSCAGYLAASMDGSAPAPAAAARASAQGDLSRESTVTIIGGRFNSPLNRVFDRGHWPALYSMLLLWRMYDQNSALIGQAYYMREFEGLMLRRDAGVSMNTRLEGGLRSSLGVVNAQVQANYENKLDFRAGSWRTVIHSDEANPTTRRARFQPAPDPRKIRTTLARAEAMPSTDHRPLSLDTEHTHSYTLIGIPEGICNVRWEFSSMQSGLYRDEPDLTTRYAVVARPDGSVPTCEFLITGVPLSTLFGGSNPPVAVPFSATIRTRDALKGAPAGDEHLSFAVRHNGLVTTNEPQPAYSAGPHEPAIRRSSDGRFKPHWEFAVNFAQNALEPVQTEAGRHAPVGGNLILHCRQGEFPLAVVAQEQADRKVQVTITTPSEFEYAKYFTEERGEECRYEGIMRVRLQRSPANRTRDIPINVQLEMPRPKPDN